MQLLILIEAHHRIDIINYEAIDLLFFDQITRLHSIKQEVIAQFRWQVSSNNFINNLLILRTHRSWSMDAITVTATIHIQLNIPSNLTVDQMIRTL